jgi:ubiquinone/menaquinone biosynthesis C-methylase UbiE
MAEEDEQKRAIAAFYSRVAASYDQVGPTVFRAFGRQIVAIAGVAAGDRVLDLAAGRGANLFAAAEVVGPAGRVVGIDLAEEMMRETSREIAARGLSSAEMLQMDAEALTFPDASFDVALCSVANIFFPPLVRAFAECWRVLVPGGRLLLTAAGGVDPRWQWYEDLLVATYERHGLTWPPVVGGHREPEEIRRILLAAGFANVREVPAEVEAIYVSAEEWWAARWTHGSRRPLETMPPEVLAEFRAAVDARLPVLAEPDGYPEVWRVRCMLADKPPA